MALRDYFNSDLAVFVSADDFATPHKINGKEANVVVDDDLYQERQQGLNNVEGYFPAAISYHIAALFFSIKPPVNSVQNFDGHPYRVESVSENEGMYFISLYDSEANSR
jgi:hypothetical protein